MKLSQVMCLAIVLLIPATLLAQQTSVINGTVMDETGTPLPGVVVSIESEALQGTRSTVTKENGRFLFRLIPPGRYTLTAAMPGMQTAKSSVDLGLGQTSQPVLTLSPEGLQGELVVTANVDPVLDSIEVAAHFSSEMVDKLATGRTQNDIALLAPGTNAAGPRGAVSISGAQTYDNLFLVNGGVANFDNIRGRPANLVIEDAIQETTVLSGAISAEYGQFLGGVVNTITKSGGNEFSGSFRAAISNNDWIARTPVELAAGGEHTDEINDIYSLTLGGPIVKDQLWFFVSGRKTSQNLIQNLSAGTPLPDALAQRLGLPAGQTAPSLVPISNSGQEDERYEVKLTGRITEGHDLIVSYLDRSTENSNFLVGGSLGSNSIVPFRSDPQSQLSLNYRGLITPEFSVDLLYTNRQGVLGGTPAPGGDVRYTGTVIRDRLTQAYYNAPYFSGAPDEERDNKTYNLKGSYFLSTENMGTHDLVFGYQDSMDRRKADNRQAASDWVMWTYTRYEGNEPIPIFTGGQNGTVPTFLLSWPIENLSQGSDFTTQSYYINDNWVLNDKWRLNLGLRADRNKAAAEDGKPVSDDSNISPRLSVEYDLRGDGKHKFSASYSQYVARLSDAAQDSSTAGSPSYIFWNYGGPITESLEDVFAWFEAEYGEGSTTDLFGPAGEYARSRAAGNGLFDPDSPNLIIGDYDASNGTWSEGSINSQTTTEYRVGYSTRWGAKAFFKADVVWRDFSEFYVVHVNQDIGPTTNGAADLGIQSNDNSLYHRDYYSVQMQGNVQLSENFKLLGNYTWAQLYGNVEGETFGSGSISLSELTTYPEYRTFDQYHPSGKLSGDIRHIARVFAVYDLHTSFGEFNFSATQNYQSGRAYNEILTLNFNAFGGAGAYGLPPAGSTNYVTPPTSSPYYLSPRGSLRTDDMLQTDLGVNYEIAFGKVDFFVAIDVFNVFNQDSASNGVNTTTTQLAAFNVFNETPVEGVHYARGALFGQPTAVTSFQTPRTTTIDFGLRF